jgi:hypothetical protein
MMAEDERWGSIIFSLAAPSAEDNQSFSSKRPFTPGISSD